MHKLLLLILNGLLVFTCGVDSMRQTKAESSQDPIEVNGLPSDNCDSTLTIRFLVIRDSLMTNASRHIEIFLDPSEHTEAKLNQLFQTLSKWYPDPEKLVIVVYNDWDQLPRVAIPPNCPGTGLSEIKNYRDNSQYSAYYSRQGSREYFSYFDSRSSTKELKTVYIRR